MTPEAIIPEIEGSETHQRPPMGSEYSSARTYLARHAEVVRRKPTAEVPAHGANDSDFAGGNPIDRT